MKEPSSGSLRSHWTSDAPPGKRATRIPAGDDLIADTRKPSTIKTYAVVTLRSRAGACGQSFRITTTWMIGGGRIDMSTLRAVPLARAPIIGTPGAPSLATASPGAANGRSGHPGETNGLARPGTQLAAWDNVMHPVTVNCAGCGEPFASKHRPNSRQPREYCARCKGARLKRRAG